jgi:hypothetical protein
MGCGCGGSVWTPAAVEGAQAPAAALVVPLGVDDPATFWRGPGGAIEAPEASEPETADAATL